MHSLFFWKNWLKEYRLLWYILAVIFVLSLLYLWYSNLRGADNVIHWRNFQEQKAIETPVHSYRLGPFELTVPAESYVILEYFNGSEVIPNTTASYIFLFVLVVSAVVILTLITTLEKFWYFVGMALFIVFVISLRLEVLGIFGLANRVPAIIALSLYIIPSFFINRFKASTPFAYRLILFATLTLIIALVIYVFSEVDLPFYHLTLTAYVPALVLSVLFIIMVAHEIMAAFVFVTTQGTSRNLFHLSIISAIYFANLMITALHEAGAIEWNFVYINLYLLFSISAVLGIWGFRQRETLYRNITQYYPFGGYFFLAMGTISIITIAQFLGNANDPSLKIIRDAIIFSHTGYTLIFIAYLFSNFVALLAENKPIYRVMYQPNRMPYFTYRFAGLIVMLAFAFYSNWRDYVYHGLSGFYNYAGDMYTLLNNDGYAESFYNQGRKQGFQNHRSNYALGIRSTEAFNFKRALEFYQRASAKNPTEYSLVNAGNVLVRDNELFGAIRTYRKSLNVMPESGPLANNMGVVYAKVHNLDSALMFLNAAREVNVSKNIAEANFFAMAALETLPLQADSILQRFKSSSLATIGNALALSALFNQSFKTTVDPLTSKKLNLYSASLLNNYIVKYAKDLDTTFIEKAYAIASDTLNEPFSEALKASLAVAYYHTGNVTRALEILAELVYISQSYQGQFNYLMGLWALEQNNPELAASFFSHAETFDHKHARFYYAISLTEAQKITEALSAWDAILVSKDENERQIAEGIKRILNFSPADALTANDADKYQFCRYRMDLKDSVQFNRIVNTFNNANYKAQALLDMSKRCFEADYVVPAIQFFRRIAGLELTDKNLYESCRHFELLMLAWRGEVTQLATQINTGVTFDKSQLLEKLLYTALLNEASGEVEKAQRDFEILGRYNPYFEEGVIAAANFFRRLDDKDMKPYTILVEAMHVNNNSIRLIKAYIAEATRLGFDDFAADAAEKLKTVIK